ncbi:MAG: glutamine synthetase family protein [Kineosporiaceae bacterium]
MATDPILSPHDLDGAFDTVVVAAPDVQGRLIGRRTTVKGFREAVAGAGIHVSTCVLGWDIAQDATLLASGALDYTGMHTGMGDLALHPDLATLRPAGWLERTAICLADAVEPDGTPTVLAPRSLLRAELEQWRRLGLVPAVGTEVEFYLYRGSPRRARRVGYRGLEPTTLSPADYAIYEGEAYEPFFADLRHRLQVSGIDVEAAQGEWGLGQWETTLRYGEALAMADRHALYKLATRSMASRAGLSATFMAKPFDGGPGSSCHVHLSVRDAQGHPLFWDDAAEDHLAPAIRHAIGGALGRAGEVMAWYAPTVNSYRRLRSQDAAGWGTTWGMDHRFCSVRVIGHHPDDLRLEFRLPGADANPYLVLTALLASVRDGLTRASDPGPATTGNPYDHPAGGPQHLGEAVAAFASSAFARATFADQVVDHYATLGRFEWDRFLDSVTDWERERYFELI